jgi:beta-phosphoglucomutase-like phosphatase (HAD superfamily)
MTPTKTSRASTALIFDWDGTLVDTRHANYEALFVALLRHGFQLPRDWYYSRTGLSAVEMIKLLIDEDEKTADIPIECIVRERDKIFLRGVNAVREISVIADIARRYHGQLPLAIASGGARAVIEPALRITQLGRLFDVVVTREDAERGKPAPDLFLIAAQRLGVSPSDCLVYEDSDEGVIAAKLAGMAVMDVRSLIS